MPIFRFLFFTFLLYCSSLIVCLSSASTPGAGGDDLQTTLCKNTTDYNFCHYVFNQDPHPGADKILLLTIGIQQTLFNATKTADFISSILSGGSDPCLSCLRKCYDYYKQSANITSDMLAYLNTDEYPYVKELIPNLQGSVDGCVGSVPAESVLKKRNFDMVRLANILTVTLKLL